MYLVPTPDGPTPLAFVDRPGLEVVYEVGDGPIRGQFRKSGVFGGDLFAVSGNEVYRGETLLGTVANDGKIARLTASDTQLEITSGGYGYIYNGTALAQITDPDLPLVADVANLAGRFVNVQQASDAFHWSAIGDGSVINGLDFATAESSPDRTRTVETLGDDLIFFGGDTVEFWNPTSSTSAPYVRSSGRRYDQGILGVTSAILDNAPWWLGSTGKVLVGRGGSPTASSSSGLNERIAECSTPDDAFAYGAVIKGQEFYVLNLPGVGTWAYQIAVQKWQKWSSFERALFRPSCAVTYQGQTYFGDSESGKIFRFNDALYEDDGEPMVRVVSAFMPLPFGTVRNKNISLLCAKGVGTATGQGVSPTVEMTYSDNVDADWSPPLQESLGVMGDRGIKTVFWQLGQMGSPGRAYQFRFTDPVPFTPYGFVINEDRP